MASDPHSYTEMSVGDVEAIGKRCQAAFCGQLDFLPFRCESCKGTFCLDHRTETAHACSNPGAWARARREKEASAAPSQPKPSILNHESQCSAPSCKTLINTALVPGIECSGCNRQYCLKHRMGEDHECDKLTLIGAKSKDKAASDAFARLKAWGASKKAAMSPSSSNSFTTQVKDGPSASNSHSSNTLRRIVSPFTSARKASQAANVIALNNLKKTAKGDSKISPEKRIYVHLEAVAEGAEGAAGAKIPRADAFYNSDWNVGKTLDAAAKTLAVTNVNNRGGGEETRLRVYHVDGGRLLDFPEKLGQSVKNGDTLVLLRGVGAP